MSQYWIRYILRGIGSTHNTIFRWEPCESLNEARKRIISEYSTTKTEKVEGEAYAVEIDPTVYISTNPNNRMGDVVRDAIKKGKTGWLWITQKGSLRVLKKDGSA